MKHPSREELMSYLYDELEVAPRRALEGHLGQCETCRAQMAAWRRTTQQLDADKTAARRENVPGWQPLMRWACAGAAAAVVLVGAFVAGRITGISRTELETARRDAAAQATAASRAEAQQLIQQFAAGVGKRLDALEKQQTSDYASLRKELETVAILTEASFRQTENRIGQIAANTPTPGMQPTP